MTWVIFPSRVIGLQFTHKTSNQIKHPTLRALEIRASETRLDFIVEALLYIMIME